MRRPVVLALVALALASCPLAAAAHAASGPTIRVSFSGTATGRFRDVERWVLLSDGGCYLRRTRDQRTSLTWAVSFLGGRSLAAAGQAAATGAVTGTEVRDSCDEVVEQLPPEAPDDWLRSVSCTDPLGVQRPARAVWEGGVLRVSAPVMLLPRRAVCSVVPRSEELRVRIPLTLARVRGLRPGETITFAVGSAQPLTGAYRPTASCLHAAKPYDGYRSFDTCVDTLTWSGVVRVTRG